MPIGTALAIGLGVAGAAGSIGGAAIGAHAAGKAADAQSQAAMYAADLQKQEADAALAFQKEQWSTNQKNIAPWLQTGTGALGNLAQLLGIGKDNGTGGFGSLMHGFDEKFVAPTDVTMQNDPGYKFRLGQGLEALQNSAAARGGLLSGGTGKQLEGYAQNYASNEYGNVYNRALGEYDQRYNIFQQNQANQFNRLSALSGTGQVAAGQLGSLGQSTADNISNILLTSGQQQGNAIQNAAAARASGYVGGANAWGGALSGLGGNFTNLLLMQNLLGGGGGSPQPGDWSWMLGPHG